MGLPGQRPAYAEAAESVQDMLFLLHAGAAKRREFLVRPGRLPLSTCAEIFSDKWLDKTRF